MKQDIKEIKKSIQTLVNQVDPWYLIQMGAPDDEYNAYIDRIVSLVVNKKPAQAILENKLTSIFHTNEFELERRKITELSSQIMNYMEQIKSS